MWQLLLWGAASSPIAGVANQASSIVQPDALAEIQVASEEMQKVQSSYVDELKNLVDTLGQG